ncbi:MAG: hypothetical protein RR058_07565 [Oscillospiraceae bacterium]
MATEKTMKAMLFDTEKPVDLLSKKNGEEREEYELNIDGKPVKLALEEILALAQDSAAKKDGEAAKLLENVPELEEFVQKYPDVLDFPKEVEEKIRRGKTPMQAYLEYENEELKRELSQSTLNQKNKKVPGSAQGDAESEDETDELLRIFNAVFE